MSEPKQVVYTPIDMDEATYAEFADIKSEEEIDFEKFRDEMRESNQYAKITISRQPTTSDGRPGQQKLIFLFECGMDEFSFSQLCSRCRDEYGTGTYRIQARNEKGQLKINKAIQVEAPKLTDERAANSPGDIISRMSEAMHQHQIRTENMIEKFQPANSNPMGMLTELATAMATIMGTLGINKVNEAPKTLLEQLTEYKMMQELFNNESGGGDANLYSLLTATMQSFGGPIAAAIAAGQTTGEVNAAGILDNPIPKLEGETEMQSKETEALKKQIMVILGNAKAGVDSTSFANIVVQNTPENMADKLYDFLVADDWFEQICFLNPECKTYENWFIAWRDTVIELLTEPADAPIVAESETVAETDTTGPDISADDSNGDVSDDT